MDSFNPSSDTYRLWRVFTYPGTGERAVAMSTAQANIFISVYTILIGLVVATTWGILISFTILFLTPKKMTRTTYIAVIATWGQTEPWSASMVLGEHSWRVFRGALAKKHPAELTWKAFWFDMALLTVALVTGLGGFVLGPFFSRTFTVGNIAPVNPNIVYYPLYSYYTDPTQQKRVAVEYDSISALKAFGSVDSAEASDQDTGHQDPVSLNWQPLDSVDGEDRYSIKYSYKVTGKDMGLQKFRDLTLEVSGNCTFQDSWWYSGYTQPETADPQTSQTLYDIFIKWEPDTLVQYPNVEQTPYNYNTSTPGNNSQAIYVPIYPRSPPSATFYTTVYITENLNQATGRSYFVIIPSVAMVPTVGTSTDPWYATQASELVQLMQDYPNMVKIKRPPLLCQEDNEWSSGSWKGTMSNLVSAGSDGPPVKLPPGIASLIQVGLGSFPMVLTLGRALTAASLRSATRLVGDERAIDTENAGALDDMKRLIQASYLATRDLFRNSALAGSELQADISSGALKNLMVDTDTGKPIPGTDGFVITSNAVQALSLSALISVPCILVFLMAIALLLQAGRKVKARTITSKPAGRIDRYINLVTGLKAPQLYRMVDQLLADRAPSDKEGCDGKFHKRQAQWKNQAGNFPFIAANRGADPNDEITIPQFHVQVKGNDRRLILDVERVKENVGHWRSLQRSDGKVKLEDVDRQVEEEYWAQGRHQEVETENMGVEFAYNGAGTAKTLHVGVGRELEPNDVDVKKTLHSDLITELGPKVQTPP